MQWRRRYWKELRRSRFPVEGGGMLNKHVFSHSWQNFRRKYIQRHVYLHKFEVEVQSTCQAWLQKALFSIFFFFVCEPEVRLLGVNVVLIIHTLKSSYRVRRNSLKKIIKQQWHCILKHVFFNENVCTLKKYEEQKFLVKLNRGADLDRSVGRVEHIFLIIVLPLFNSQHAQWSSHS